MNQNKIIFYNEQYSKFKEIGDKKKDIVEGLRKNIRKVKENNKIMKAKIINIMKQNKMVKLKKEMLLNSHRRRMKETPKPHSFKSHFRFRFSEKDLSEQSKNDLVDEIYEIISEQKVILYFKI